MSETIDLECTSGVDGKWSGKTFIPDTNIVVSTEYLNGLDIWLTSVFTATMKDDTVVTDDYSVRMETFYSYDNTDAFFCHDIMVTKYNPSS